MRVASVDRVGEAVVVKDLRSPASRLDGRHPARPVHEGELVGIHVEVGKRTVALGIRSRRLEQFALGANGDVLARAHRQGSGKQAGDTGDENDLVGHTTRTDADHEGEIRDEAVVRPEDGGAKRTGEPVASPLGEAAHHLGMDPFVRGHGRCCIRIRLVGRSRFGSLSERQHEDRPEAPGEETEQACAQVTPARLTDLIAEQAEPVLLVPTLGFGECEQDLPLPSGATAGKIAVDGGLGLLVGEILSPAPQVRGGRTCRG